MECDLFDQMALIDMHVDLELARSHKGDGGQLAVAFLARLHGGIVRHGGFQHPVRGDPELLQAFGGEVRSWGNIFPDLVPGLGTAQHQNLTLLAHYRLPATTAGRRFCLRADDPVPH
jgi:hypothetical protein